MAGAQCYRSLDLESCSVLLDKQNPWADQPQYRTLLCRTEDGFFVRVATGDGNTFFQIGRIIASYPGSMEEWNEYYSEMKHLQMPACRCFARDNAIYMLVDFISSPVEGLTDRGGQAVFDALRRLQGQGISLQYGPQDLARGEPMVLPTVREAGWCPGRAWGVGFPAGAYLDVLSELLPIELDRELWEPPRVLGPLVPISQFCW